MRSIGCAAFGNRLANSAAPIVAATATVTVGNDCGKAGLMTIADRVALLFFAAVFSVAVGASIDGGLRSPYAAPLHLAVSHCVSAPVPCAA